MQGMENLLKKYEDEAEREKKGEAVPKFQDFNAKELMSE